MKECTHCGAPNAPENRVCDYCGMGFSEDTIPEGSVDPRETAKEEAEAYAESLKEKKPIEVNLDDTEDQNITINTSSGEKIVINDPVEKASSLVSSLITGAAAVAGAAVGSSMNNNGNRRPPEPPRDRGMDRGPQNFAGNGMRNPNVAPGSPRRPSRDGGNPQRGPRPQQTARRSGGCGVLMVLAVIIASLVVIL